MTVLQATVIFACIGLSIAGLAFAPFADSKQRRDVISRWAWGLSISVGGIVSLVIAIVTYDGELRETGGVLGVGGWLVWCGTVVIKRHRHD